MPLFSLFGKSTGRHHQLAAPIIADPTKRPANEDFRLPEDPPHLVRLNQNPPHGLRRKLVGFVPVAGVTRPEVLPNVIAFIRGSRRSIELQRQPHNPVDSNAIAVLGRWLTENGEASGPLGFIPAETAAIIAGEPGAVPLGATIEVLYDAHEDRSPGIRVDIWVPSRPPRKVIEKPARNLKVPTDPVARNLRGKELEKEGFIQDAIQCYEANVRDGFDGNFPYDRLVIIYRRRKARSDEIRVLERAVAVFHALGGSPRLDIQPKVARFEARLAKLLRK